MGLEPFENKFSEKEIKELAEKLKWKGSGTEQNPIIIPNEQGLPQKLCISLRSLHLKIVDSTFEHLILFNSVNISIESSSSKIFGIFYSTDITVNNCKLSNLNLEKCSESYFINCSIEKVGNVRSHGNTFGNCQISDRVKKELLLGLFNLPSLKHWPIAVAVYGFGIVIFALIYVINSLQFSLYWYLSVILFFPLIIVFIYLSRYQKKHIPNKIISKRIYSVIIRYHSHKHKS
jgi:hypothetical protein